ncbi:unnamed protein product [Rhizoctonia solani]|uniref:Geranylgeranyl pyrophosphate synthetase n=3 Tax=Rhizoctonia solani TaxID=456999 RepID=A0A8H3CEP5_9AGAM|nr:geranylgeranyl pyrophosphate synthetase, putative [Rhizoctonia solani AG-3 Rhs1AP]KEP47780.1 putative geranylgeranyl pyrophosphate synthetase [Rhizoctonia solani 123E]CAE6481139.1 unnamed protein product [Rhizoctonia solani]CAE6495265.1 unnamed protein product [Rhizoctonia solani]
MMSSPFLLGISESVATVPSPSGNPDSTPVEVTNLKALGSYNWVEDTIPTIAIPGHPPVWKDQPLPIRLREDLGAPFFDDNIARNISFPLEPDILAIEVSQAADPDFDLSKENIDIVSNRNNLRKLINFANSGGRNAGRYIDKFRIDAQLALNGRTMILTRYEKPRYKTQVPVQQKNDGPQQSARQQPNNGRTQRKPFIGFDHIFERMCTEELPTIRASDSGGSVSLRPIGYHRIVRYDLLGLRFLVRSRVDTMQNPGDLQLDSTSETEIDSLTKALEKTGLESDPERVEAETPLLQEEESGVRYVKFGKHVPQDHLMDIKVVPNGKVDWNNAYPQYLLSQTPSLRVATRATVRDQDFVAQLKTYDLDSLKTEHEIQAQRFRNLVSVLKEMRQALQTHGSSSQPLAFVWTQRGEIVAYKIDEKSKYVSDKGLDKF